MIGMIILLFSISLVPENIGFNFTFELRPLIFATLILGLILKFGFSVWRKDDELKKSKFKFVSIDIAYFAAICLTIISFVTKAQNINAFNFVFVAVGMFVVYFAVRFANLDDILLPSKIIYNVVGIAFIIAVIGLVQLVLGKPVVSTFGRTSYLGCFLAMNAAVALGTALQLRVTNYKLRFKKFNIGFWLAVFAFLVIFGVTILTKSRTAMIAMAVVLPIIVFATKTRRLKEKKKSVEKKELKTKLYKRKSVKLLSCLGVLVALFFIFNIGKAVYRIRPMSASGRVLIWKVSAEMFKKNPITGVGFGNFANTYNFYQATYFASGKGSVINKMTAGQIRHAYNWYLETAVEFGLFGLIVFGIFWWLILVEAYKVFFPRNTDHGTRTTPACAGHADYVNLGMSGVVLCFMIMSLFQFPRKIIPTYLIFNFALAWIVNANLETQKPQETQVNYQNNFKEQSNKSQWNNVCISHGQEQNRWLKIVWISVGIISLFFVAIYFQRYMAARQWHKAHELACSGKYQEAENIYSNIYPKLKWNGRFLFYYGNVKLQNKEYGEAISLFEKAKFTYPDPYMFENLGVAYMNYSALADFQQNVTNEEHPPKSPLKGGINPPVSPFKKGGLELTQDECINKAINYWMLASNILPWRLTPKYYLADLFYRLGETNEAIKYARLVVNTPMKKWTKRGKEFKLKSQKMLMTVRQAHVISLELGTCPETREAMCSWKKCDDPGLIVFDINDKKTWNEGKW